MKLDGVKQYNQNYSQKQNRKNNPQFTGWVDTTLRFLDTNQAWGANAVDLGLADTELLQGLLLQLV